jgi:MFS family permease
VAFVALITIYGLAGFGVAAFTPSALSLVGDAAAPGRAGYAFAWYTTAHYGAIAVGPFLGGLAAQWWGYRESFVGSAIVVAAALVFGLALPCSPRKAWCSRSSRYSRMSGASPLPRSSCISRPGSCEYPCALPGRVAGGPDRTVHAVCGRRCPDRVGRDGTPAECY